jgi:hypothetical protein
MRENLHPPAVTPGDATVLWRYMDVSKFLFLVTSSQLYMARLDKLADKYEGTWPSRTSAAAQRNLPSKKFEVIRVITQHFRTRQFVSCWCASERESWALWKAYAGSTGVAVLTTVGRLRDSVVHPRSFHIGRVEYLDFNEAPVQKLNLFRPSFLKRAEFGAEQEVRLLVSEEAIQRDQSKPFGETESLLLRVKLEQLLERVVIGPESPTYLAAAVKELLARFGLTDVEVKHSTL